MDYSSAHHPGAVVQETHSREGLVAKDLCEKFKKFNFLDEGKEGSQ